MALWCAAPAAPAATPPQPAVESLAQPAPAPQLQSRRGPGVGLGGPFAPTAHPSLDGSPVEYLILTNGEMAPAFERLAAWKTAKGVPAVVRTLDQVLASGVHGSDLAETLRLYIRAAYLDWGVRWVLLGGDTDVIPARYVRASFLGLVDPVADLYYACLDGDWNADGDASYGEAWVDEADPGDDADLIAEVFLGRAPASTSAEAGVFVDKALAYEDPAVIDFQDKVLFLAEVLFPADWAPGQVYSIDGADFAEALMDSVDPILPPAARVTRLYETAALRPPGASPLTVANATTQIDAGHGTIVHIGHGYRYTLSMGNGSADIGRATSYANGVRSGLFYMLNCTAAAFDFESFAEALVLNPNGGATLVVGASREAFPLAARDYQREFFRDLFVEGRRRVGEAMARSREQFVGAAYFMNVDRWTQLVYTLLGDPEAAVWGAAPRDLQLEGLPAGLQVGSQVVTVQVRDPLGVVPGALVCARRDGEDYQVGRSDALGQVSLRLEPRSAGPVQFTVSAADHRPLRLEVPASAPARALVVAGTTLDDDGAGSGSGNADGRLDAGETASLLVAVRNQGTTAATAVQATLTSADAAVQVVQGSADYGTLAAQASGSGSVPFVVQVPPGTADGHLATLELALQHSGLAIPESRRVELLVHAARPRLVGLRLSDTRAGNGNGVQEPNETVDVFYTLENLGTGTGQGLHLLLRDAEAGLEVLVDSVAVPPLLPGAGLECPAALAVREADVGTAHAGRLVLRHLQDSAGTARRFDLRAPAAPSAPSFVTADAPDAVHVEWSPPPDPDLAGYHIWRADAPGGPFVRVDADLLRSTYFRDAGLQPSRRYYYRVAAVDSTLQSGPPGPAAGVSTNPPQSAGWPQSAGDRSSSSIAIADVDGDGGLDVVSAATQVYAWSALGIELLDADQNALTYGRFFGNTEVFGSVTLADLDPLPGKEIVVATWSETERFAVVLRGDGQPLDGWPQPLVPAPAAHRGAAVAPVVANLDGQGAPEILLAARDGRLYGWHADGSEIADGDADPATHGVLLATGSPYLRSAPAVADLDPSRAGFEIVIGGTDGVLHVLDAHGAALPGWPRSTFGAGTAFGGQFASSAAIGDLDRDGTREMVFLDGSNRLHALHLDGSDLPGFPVAGIQAVSGSTVPSPALGNLLGDDRLEIVAASSDGWLFLVDAAGVKHFPGGAVYSGARSESSPILGDVDGDPDIEVVFGNEDGLLQAWNLDGTPANGFPLSLRAEVRGTPTLADVDGDGTAELAVLTWDGRVQIWALGVAWQPARYPWPTCGGNVHRTGEYGYAVPTPVVASELAADWDSDSGVHLRWRGAEATDGGEVVWRVRRSPPLPHQPLGSSGTIAYNEGLIGEIRGSGSLEFVDAGAQPDAWYVYVLGALEGRPGGAGEVEIRVGSVVVNTATAPAALRLLPNVPNPFNPATRLAFEVPGRKGDSRVEVHLTLYDQRGRRVRQLMRGSVRPGVHAVQWDGRDDAGTEVGSGVYLVRLQAAEHQDTGKITLVR